MHSPSFSSPVASTSTNLAPTPTSLVAPHHRKRLSTQLAYSRDVQRWQRGFGGTIPASAEDLTTYIVQQCKRVAASRLLRRLMAIQDAHVTGGHASPTADPGIRDAMRLLAAGKLPSNLLPEPKGRRSSPQAAEVAQKRQVKPVTRALLLRMFDAMGRRTSDLRDRSIILLGFSGFKRATICAMDVSSLAWTDDAMLVHVGLKSEAEESEAPVAKGRVVAIPKTGGPLCAATAVRQWLEHNDMIGRTGPVFPRFTRSGEPVWSDRLDSGYVPTILKERLKAAGIMDVSDYSSESLRKGRDLEAVKGARS